MSFVDLISLRAFKHSARNAHLPLARRLPGQRVLVLGVGSEMVKAAVVELPVQPDGLPIVIHCEVCVRRNASSASGESRRSCAVLREMGVCDGPTKPRSVMTIGKAYRGWTGSSTTGGHFLTI